MTTCSVDRRVRVRTALARALLLWLTFGAGAGAIECVPLEAADENVFGVMHYERGLLWEVTAPSGPRSYLFGTMHVGDPRVHRAAERARTHLAEARVFALEVVLDAGAMSSLQAAMFLAPGRRLDEQLGGGLFERVVGVASAYGLNREIVSRMKPWAVFATLSLPPGDTGLALDFALLEQARAAGTAVVGLESIDEQIAVFESIDLADQLAIVRDMACHHDRFQADMETMIERYAAGDLRGLVDVAFKYSTQNSDDMLETLIWARNALMVERMQAQLERGDAFVAIGALHLPGERGVLELLARRGFQLKLLY